MTRTTAFTLPLILLIACGGRKTVPNSALAVVPSERIAELKASQEAVHADRTAIEAAERNLMELEEQAALARRAEKEADVSVDEATGARAVAVRVGDEDRATDLASDLDATQERLEDRKKSAALLASKVELAERVLEEKKAALELQVATLELERAKAAVQGGADLKLKRFEKPVEKARADHDDAVAEVEELEKEMD